MQTAQCMKYTQQNSKHFFKWDNCFSATTFIVHTQEWIYVLMVFPEIFFPHNYRLYFYSLILIIRREFSCVLYRLDLGGASMKSVSQMFQVVHMKQGAEAKKLYLRLISLLCWSFLFLVRGNYLFELKWTASSWVESNWIESNWIELNWSELNWIELNRTICVYVSFFFIQHCFPYFFLTLLCAFFSLFLLQQTMNPL